MKKKIIYFENELPDLRVGNFGTIYIIHENTDYYGEELTQKTYQIAREHGLEENWKPVSSGRFWFQNGQWQFSRTVTQHPVTDSSRGYYLAIIRKLKDKEGEERIQKGIILFPKEKEFDSKHAQDIKRALGKTKSSPINEETIFRKYIHKLL